jgi:hypothetical protein
MAVNRLKTALLSSETLSTNRTSNALVYNNANLFNKTRNNGFRSTRAAGNGVIASASTGTITYDGGYTVHTFNATGSITFSTPGEVEVVVIAGGGGGQGSVSGAGGGGSGGGGGGGYVYAITSVPVGLVPVSVGAGGSGANPGVNSSFRDILALGGGRNGRNDNGTFVNHGQPGGSGGGAGSHAGNYPGNPTQPTYTTNPTQPKVNVNFNRGESLLNLQSGAFTFSPNATQYMQGLDGQPNIGLGQYGNAGVYYGANDWGGGGGGAGGTNTSATRSGGIGKRIVGFHPVNKAGGGGGSQRSGSPTGGVDGGGNGGTESGGGPTSGTANTGGGAGCGYSGGTVTNGGSGVVIIRFPTQLGV